MSSLHSPIDWIRWIGRNTKRVLVFLVGVDILLAGVGIDESDDVPVE